MKRLFDWWFKIAFIFPNGMWIFLGWLFLSAPFAFIHKTIKILVLLFLTLFTFFGSVFLKYQKIKSEQPTVFPNSYDNRLWHAGSLEGCTGYVRGQIEWCVIDDDGGICIALCPGKEEAEEIARRLNGPENKGEQES